MKTKPRRHEVDYISSRVGMVLILWLALMVGCRGNAVVSHSQQSQSPSSHDQSIGPSSSLAHVGFKQRLDAGAGCAELFEIRNSLDPKASDVVRMNEELREIGCYSSSSVRSSTVSVAEKTKSEKKPATATFTVNEYKMYRAVLDVPSTVREQQALQNVARQYEIPVEDLRKVVNKVQKSLFDNKWFGTPESEVQHASETGSDNDPSWLFSMTTSRITSRLILAITFLISIVTIGVAVYFSPPNSDAVWAVIAASLAVIASVIAAWTGQKALEIQEDSQKPYPYPMVDASSRYGLLQLRVKNTGGSPAHDICKPPLKRHH